MTGSRTDRPPTSLLSTDPRPHLLLLPHLDDRAGQTRLNARCTPRLLVLVVAILCTSPGPALAQDQAAPFEPRPDRAALTLALLHDAESVEREAWLERAASLARASVARDSTDLDALFVLGASIGLRTPYVSLGERINLAEEVLACSRRILQADPNHPGGLHLYAQLNVAGMRLNRVVRFVAQRVLGSDVLDDASWAAAERALRSAIRAEPDNPAHRLELAYLLRETGRPEEARAMLARIVGEPDPRPLGDYYRRKAWRALSALR